MQERGLCSTLEGGCHPAGHNTRRGKLFVPLAKPTVLVCLRIESTDLNDLMCKIHLVLEVPGVAAQRITSVAWKRRVGGIVRPSA
jgi:hypothetical protein